MANTLSTELGFPEVYALVRPMRTTTQTLADKVKHKLQDDSYDIDYIQDVIYQGLMEIAGEVLLPELETTVDVLTDPDQPSVPLPADYHKKLQYCHSTTHNQRIHVYGTVVQLYRQFSVLNQTGRVLGVAPKGRNFYYQRVPSSAETLKITYYRYPERIEALDLKPTCLPAHLAEPLLVNYALKEIYDEIEDALETNSKPNADRYERRYTNYHSQLIAFLGPEEKEPVDFAEEIPWDAYML